MNRRFTNLILSILIAIPSFGGIFDSTRIVLPSKGSKAIDFGYSGLLSFGSFSGNTIAFKTFSSPYMASRLILDINLSGTDLSGERTDYNQRYYMVSDTIIIDTNEFVSSNKNIRNSFSILFHRIKYQKPYNNLSLYYGIGPILGLEASETVSSDVPDNNFVASYNNGNSKSLTLFSGVSPSLGIEWFFSKNFSFHVEYLSQFRIGWKRVTTKTERGGSNYKDFQNESQDGLYYYSTSHAYAGVSFFFR